MNRLVNLLTSNPLFPPALTSAVFFASLFAVTTITIDSVALFFITCGFQIFIGVYEKLDFAVIKLENKKAKTSKPLRKWGSQGQIGLSLTPIVHLLAPALGWLYLLLHVLLFSQSIVVFITRLLNRKSIRQASLREFERYQPQVAVYVSGMREVAYQINQWIPVLEKLPIRAIIIIRENGIFDDMPNTAIPIFTAKGHRQMEALLDGKSSIKTVLYPANPMKNVQALRYFHLNHYFINHGESDKAVNQNKLMMAYDKLLLAGPLSEQRLRNAGLPLRKDQVEHVGRPQAEILLDQVEKSSDIKTILYAPTWEGYVQKVDYSSIGPLGYTLCKQLLESGKYNLIFKPHPYTGGVNGKKAHYLKDIKALCERHGAKVWGEDASLHELMNQSDLLICDISSVLNEYLITQKPIVLCKTGQQDIESFLGTFPSSRAATVFEEGHNALDVIANIEQRDERQEERARVRRESLGDFPEGALARFAQVLDDSIANKASGEEN
jgi:hypothetical protein